MVFLIIRTRLFIVFYNRYAEHVYSLSFNTRYAELDYSLFYTRHAELDSASHD